MAEDEEGAPETAPAPEVVTPRTVVEKDDQGRTQLHHLVSITDGRVHRLVIVLLI